MVSPSAGSGVYLMNGDTNGPAHSFLRNGTVIDGNLSQQISDAYLSGRVH